MDHQGGDKRLNDILDMIGRIAALDFSKELDISEKNDMIDAIALGLNMLSEELNSQVVDKRKLDEVNRKLEKFAYTAAHDLKSPLNSQAGLIRLLELYVKPEPGSELQECITKLKSINEKMKMLVGGILNYSLAQSKEVEKETVDFLEVLKEIIESDNFSEYADIQILDPLPVVKFNRTGAVQIMRNLIDNSIKYSNKERCKIDIHSKEYEDHHKVIYQDNGPGIPKEYEKDIFNLFNQLNPSHKSIGTGIGLATTKSIIESAGGKIWLDSDSKGNEGARFVFTIRKHT